ncbi:MAG: ankyrin repeat domain-containing protein, partial [Acidobacteria bacterium]|nr:ankyrin repeat domain-containing protein [Acidobacteriota bacterium]
PEAASRPDPDGASPLWVALMRSHRLEDRSCLRTLLDAGADPSREQADRFHLARPVVLQEDVELLRELLDRGMDPESTNDEGYNTLHWASVYGMVDGARLLLERGVDAGAKTLNDQTALDIVRDRRERRMESLEEVESEEHRTVLAESLRDIEEMIALLEG